MKREINRGFILMGNLISKPYLYHYEVLYNSRHQFLPIMKRFCRGKKKSVEFEVKQIMGLVRLIT